MTLYFGGEMDAAIGSDSGVVEDSGAGYDGTYSRCSVICNGGAFMTPFSFSATSSLWSHAYHSYFPLNGGQRDVMRWLNGSGTTVFKVTADGFTNGNTTSTYRMFYYNGSGFTQIGSGCTVSIFSGNYIDVRIVGGASGSAAFYVADSVQDSGTATMTNVAAITHVQQAGADIGGKSYWSQWIGDTTSTVGRRLKTLVEDTNGAVQQWTGSVSNINEKPYDDSTGITSSSAGDISTYYQNGLSLSGLNILGMGTSARFNTTSGPTGLQNAIRVSSTNYFGATLTGSSSFAVNQNMWATNPNTGQAWTPATAAGIEWGVKSIA